MEMREVVEPSAAANEWSRRVIGAAIEVHRTLGPGFLESVYEGALTHELRLREIPFERQVRVLAKYKGVIVGEGRVDFIIADELIVELKAVERVLGIHEAQLISYLKARQLQLGLLLNFRCATLREGLKRVVYGRKE